MSTTMIPPETRPSGIVYVQGDLLDDDADMLVNPANCVGIAGAGLSKQFRTRFPWSIHAYRGECLRGHVQPGSVLVTLPGSNRGPIVAHLPTKRHWRDASRLEDVRAGLTDLRRLLEDMPVHSIAIPRLGCGLGGLAWSDVRSLIEEILGDLPDVEVRVYSRA